MPLECLPETNLIGPRLTLIERWRATGSKDGKEDIFPKLKKKPP
jgi:hypothetical protein